jgi:hypothetical protein
MFHYLRSIFRSRLHADREGPHRLIFDSYARPALNVGPGVIVYKTVEGYWLFNTRFDWIHICVMPLGSSLAAIRAAAEMYFGGYHYAVEEHFTTTAEERAAPHYHPDY